MANQSHTPSPDRAAGKPEGCLTDGQKAILSRDLEANNVEINAMDVSCLWSMASVLVERDPSLLTPRRRAAMDRVREAMEALFPAPKETSSIEG